ncbi:MAG: hypothetical protein V4613_09785 [Bacteroidota bacterium]
MIVRICIFLMVIGSACQAPVTKSSVVFFDFKQFFENEIKQLESGKIKLRKTVITGDEVTANEEVMPLWKDELSVFIANTTIKPGQYENYRIDSVKRDNGFWFLTYTATTATPDVKYIEIMFNPSKKVERITIISDKKGSMGSNDITMTYLPMKGYDIKGEIRSRIGTNRVMDIHAECY